MRRYRILKNNFTEKNMKKKKSKAATDGTDSGNLRQLKMCTELSVPQALKGDAIRAAVNENPNNLLPPDELPVFARSALAIAASHIDKPAIAVAVTKRWKRGRTLRVIFLDNPSAKVRQKIEQYAHEWEKYVSVRFVFGTDPNAEIRITCNIGDGSWSYLGTDALTIPKNEATMNYGWFNDNTPDSEFSRTVLHEFGHALGAIHEHQHPGVSIPWNRPAVYQYYKDTQDWSKEEVDEQIFKKYDQSRLNMSAYDQKSIMHYAIEAKLLLDPTFAVGWNRSLSANDKAFMKALYP